MTVGNQEFEIKRVVQRPVGVGDLCGTYIYCVSDTEPKWTEEFMPITDSGIPELEGQSVYVGRVEKITSGYKVMLILLNTLSMI